MQKITLIFLTLVLTLSCTSTNKLDKKQTNSNNQPSISFPNSVEKFSTSLYHTLENTDENVFFSPYSILMAMNMAYLGSADETEKEFKDILYLAPNTNDYHQAVNQVNNKIIKNDSSANQVSIANNLWIQEKFELNKNYQDRLHQYYSIDVNLADFIQPEKREQARKNINSWVEKQTHEKITNLIGEGILDENTRLILVNAIHFLGKWEYPFSAGKNKKQPFFQSNGSQASVTFMQKDLTLLYSENDNLQSIELPYKGNEFSMIFLKKKENVNNSYASLINPEVLQEMRNNASKQFIHIEIPKFSAEQKYDLVSAFKKMGMKNTFNAQANFSMMRKENDLKISNILHKAFIQVDEEGTEAAAATSVAMSLKMAHMPPEKSFVADHPFLFFIKHQETGTILFFGQINIIQ